MWERSTGRGGLGVGGVRLRRHTHRCAHMQTLLHTCTRADLDMHTHACTHVNNVYAQRRAKVRLEMRQMWVRIPAPLLHLCDLRCLLLLESPRESTLLDFCDSSVSSNTAPGTWWKTRICHVNSCSFPHLPGCWSL